MMDTSGTSEEKRALHLYRETAGPEMSNYFDAPFWNAAVLQISHELPAVKHGLMATGSLYEYLISTSASIVPPQEFSLIQTSKSIDKLINDKSNLVAILTCCILFVAHGNVMDDLSSLGHLKSGLHIIREIQLRPEQPLWTGLTPAEKETVQGLLIPMIYRLSRWMYTIDPVQATAEALWSRGIALSIQSPTVPSVFTNIRHAEECHNNVVHWALSRLRRADTPSGYKINPDDIAAISWESKLFVHALDIFIEQLEPNKDPRSTTITGAAALLKASHVVALLCLKATTFTMESDYDQFEPEFREIVTCCQTFIRKAETKYRLLGRKLYFGSDHSFLLPLFMVARCARDPVLRRRAIKILGESEVAEGIAGSGTLAMTANILMRIEESGIDLVTKASDIPESNRVRLHSATMFVYLSQAPQARMTITRQPYKPTDQQVMTEIVWAKLKRERPSVSDGQYEFPIHKHYGPTLMPNNVEDIIEQDKACGVYPDIVIVRASVAWADWSTSPPTYDYLRALHHLLDGETLHF